MLGGDFLGAGSLMSQNSQGRSIIAHWRYQRYRSEVKSFPTLAPWSVLGHRPITRKLVADEIKSK